MKGSVYALDPSRIAAIKYAGEWASPTAAPRVVREEDEETDEINWYIDFHEEGVADGITTRIHYGDIEALRYKKVNA